jgi:hypothetical protein
MNELQMKYFVLEPIGDGPYARASRLALLEYAFHISSTNPELSRDLKKWAYKEMDAAAERTKDGTKRS